MTLSVTSTRTALTDLMSSRVVRFLGAGIINTAFGYGVFAILVLAGVHPQVALVAQFGLGVIWNFSIHARFVFGVSGFGRLPLYGLAYVVAYAFNALLLAGLTGAGVPALGAQLLSLPPVVALSYVLVARALGAHRNGKDEQS
ncbi:GtrA family protein [Stappia sp. BW2]|jgi:putative flippase GtrA|uniref:GtrA family protein n=1 Tax=Stappia sp. BW2 TaxID=2592622 RepID=UPI0011DEFE03|nr:GtrA family protein [Stappia sp. BW2]TYC75972.1 GtrA family protein [Stappia sp. BW2]